MKNILTSKEKQIFELLVNNYSTSAIADMLKVSRKTVSNHISNVIQKLSVCNRSQAIIELIKLDEINL